MLVVLDWSDPGVWDGARAGERAVHMLTNSRAHTGAEAGALVASAAAAARLRHPGARLILRGDSTLRAHVWEEYAALRAVVYPGREDVPLLLVPALPAAGRVTIGGRHLLERDGERVPLEETEYARDGALAYSDSDLARWADERSGGRLAAADAVRIPLERLRRPAGANDIAAAIAAAAAVGRPAVVIPDAETDADLRTIARGLRAAEEARIAVIVRCAPAFAAVLTGAEARSAGPGAARRPRHARRVRLVRHGGDRAARGAGTGAPRDGGCGGRARARGRGLEQRGGSPGRGRRATASSTRAWRWSRPSAGAIPAWSIPPPSGGSRPRSPRWPAGWAPGWSWRRAASPRR